MVKLWWGEFSIVLWLKSPAFSGPVSWGCPLLIQFSVCPSVVQIPYLSCLLSPSMTAALPIYLLEALPPVDYMSPPSPLMRQELEGLGWQKGSSLSSDKALAKYFPMESRPLLWSVSPYHSSSSPQPRRSCSDAQYENLVGFPEGNHMKVQRPP